MTNSIEQTVIKKPICRNRRSTKERALIVAVASLGFLFIVSVIGIIVLATNLNARKFNNNRIGEHTFCTTPACIHSASEILNKIDEEVEPCDNFYRFACGSFLKNTIIPNDQVAVDSFSIIEAKVQEQLRKIIEEANTPMDPRPFKLVKNLYRSCMNETAIEAQSRSVLISFLKQLGGWPVLERDLWDEETFDWVQSIYKFRDLGVSVNYFLDFSASVDLKNTTKQILYLDQATLGLCQEYLSQGLKDEKVNAYYAYMVDIAVILGAERESAKKQLTSALEFEMKLANISAVKEELRDSTVLYNPMTITQLSEMYPSIPWKEYFNRLLPASIQINDSEVIIVTVPSYIKSLEKLMKETPKRIQANYMMWRAVAASVSYLNNEMRNRQLQYMAVVSGETERESRWIECIDIVSGGLPISVGALYVRRYFHEKTKRDAVEMVDYITKQLIATLQSVEWMDNETRNRALDKATSMTSHIAYPDELLDDRKLEIFYQNLELTDENFFQGILNLSSFLTEYSFSELRKPFNKSDWVTHGDSATVNAFYAPTENSIEIPAAILQGAFFNYDRPKYMNYGAIGFVIGHELTHGFDDEGQQYDKEGNLVNWWEPTTKEKYLAKTQCIIDQYGNYSVEDIGLNLNGINTQGENFADNAGMKEAYLAYNDWSSQNGQEQMLPGLPYTPTQMFWISAATSWCATIRPELLELDVITDEHSPPEFRIIGSLSNIPEFANDFNCPVGSKMNPENRCTIW